MLARKHAQGVNLTGVTGDMAEIFIVNVQQRRIDIADNRVDANNVPLCFFAVEVNGQPIAYFIVGEFDKQVIPDDHSIFVAVLEALMTPLFIAFYRLRALGPAWQLLLVAVLGTWALVVNGTFFAAMSLRTRSREIMLPLLLFPISIPAILAMVQATTAILTGESSPRFWIVLLVSYDLVFTTSCLLLFETVLNAE